MGPNERTSSRRAFLRAALLHVGSVPLFGGMVGCGKNANLCEVFTDFDPQRAQVMDAFFTQRLAAAARIGRAYLSHYPDDDGCDATVESLLAPVTEAMDAADSVDEAVQSLDGRIQADFEGGAVVVVEGWVLSQMEAGICLLAHLYEVAA